MHRSLLGLLFGVMFGFLLQKGGATDYNVITGQLLLTDFTVMKLMLSAVIVGMIGFHLLKHFGYAKLHAAEGSIGSNVIGGLIFGVGFALLDIARERLPGQSEQERLMLFLAGWSGC